VGQDLGSTIMLLQCTAWGSTSNENNSTRPRKEKRLIYILNDSNDTKHCAGINCLSFLMSVTFDRSDYLFTRSHDDIIKRWLL
ncbi:unnamed protein product, partial [Sphenostylis stenocarpa]